MPSRGPPAYNDTDSSMADGVGPVHRTVDGPLTIPGGKQPPAAMRHDVNGPVGSSRPGFHGPVGHRQMDGAVSPSNGLMAHRGLVTFCYHCIAVR